MSPAWNSPGAQFELLQHPKTNLASNAGIRDICECMACGWRRLMSRRFMFGNASLEMQVVASSRLRRLLSCFVWALATALCAARAPGAENNSILFWPCAASDSDAPAPNSDFIGVATGNY